MINTKIIGDFGENQAEKHLKKKNWHILSRNYRTRGGEIDIIGYKRGVLVFFEVKTRSNESYGKPREAVDEEKVQKINTAAREFLNSYRFGGKISVFYPFGIELKRKIRKTRIDVIEVYISQNRESVGINHIKDWENKL